MLTFKCDIRSAEQLRSAAAATLSEFGSIDILVGNAAVWHVTPLVEISDQEWQTEIDVNVTGTWNTVRAVVPAIIEQQRGAIVLTSSLNGLKAAVGMTHYTVAKHGVIGLMRNVALELAQSGIRCNAVCLGAVDTKMNDWQGAYDMIAGHEGASPEDRRLGAYSWHALRGRGLLDPRSVSRAVLWLASDDSADITVSPCPLTAVI